MALAYGPPDGDGEPGGSHDLRPCPRDDLAAPLRWRFALTLALLVAAALVTTETPAEPVGPRPLEETGAEQLQPKTATGGHGPLLYVPLKLLSVLDQDFSLGPWTFRGYVQFDGADYSQDPAGSLETDFRRGPIGSGDAPNARALADGSYLRKARLGGEGQWGENLS
jgi:hypothetical protein